MRMKAKRVGRRVGQVEWAGVAVRVYLVVLAVLFRGARTWG